jgi:hypothetical protein
MHGLLSFAALTVIAWMLYRFVLRGAVRIVLRRAGETALAKQPDRIRLERVSFPRWRDERKVSAQAEPLLARGFRDLGTYAAKELPGVAFKILLNESEKAAAYIYEHPKVGVWTELSSRYEDGSMTMLVNRPPTGIASPPFVRKLLGDPAEPTDRHLARLLKERETRGLKLVTASTVVSEYEEAWLRIMTWQKNKGLSVEEVAAAVRSRLQGEKPGA